MPQHLDQTGYAVIDIGSNSVRMVIYDLDHLPCEQVFNEKVFCALGRDLATTGYLSPSGVQVALKAIHGFFLIAEAQQVKTIVAVATAAVRDAKDGPEFIADIYKTCGLSIRTLSGDEEATYAARGVLALDPNAKGFVGDFGGGSLEFAKIGLGTISDTVSLPLGAFRVQAMGDRAEQDITALLQPVVDTYRGLPALHAIGGSWRGLAQAYMRELGPARELQGYAIPSSSMIEFCQRIEQTSLEDLRKIHRFEGHRAGLAGISAMVLRVVLRQMGPSIFVTSLAGVRDGMVHEFLSSHSKEA